MSWLRNLFGHERRLHRVEFDLGEKDVLILTFPQLLRSEQRAQIKTMCEEALKKAGRVALVIDGGATVQIAHRKMA